jgi:type III restriction enzyme
MENRFFEHPILNSPYDYPIRHWEMDEHGQPTQRIAEVRRTAQFVTPIPKPRKQKQSLIQEDIEFDDETGISTRSQRYETIPIINELRQQVDEWRRLPSPNDWLVTPETARLLQHWRHHQFEGIRPFFCQVEAVETAIWLTEVAPKRPAWKRFVEHLASANANANPGLNRLALKLATGAGKTTVMAMLIAGSRSMSLAVRAVPALHMVYLCSHRDSPLKIACAFFSPATWIANTPPANWFHPTCLTM